MKVEKTENIFEGLLKNFDLGFLLEDAAKQHINIAIEKFNNGCEIFDAESGDQLLTEEDIKWAIIKKQGVLIDDPYSEAFINATNKDNSNEKQ